MLNRETFIVCQSGDSAGEFALENLSCQDIILVQNSGVKTLRIKAFQVLLSMTAFHAIRKTSENFWITPDQTTTLRYCRPVR